MLPRRFETMPSAPTWRAASNNSRPMRSVGDLAPAHILDDDHFQQVDILSVLPIVYVVKPTERGNQDLVRM